MLMLLGGINVYPEIFQQQYPYMYKDFKAVGNISLSIGCIAVVKDAPYKTMKDFVEAAKKASTPIKYSRAASGGTHITRYFWLIHISFLLKMCHIMVTQMLLQLF